MRNINALEISSSTKTLSPSKYYYDSTSKRNWSTLNFLYFYRFFLSFFLSISEAASFSYLSSQVYIVSIFLLFKHLIFLPDPSLSLKL